MTMSRRSLVAGGGSARPGDGGRAQSEAGPRAGNLETHRPGDPRPLLSGARAPNLTTPTSPTTPVAISAPGASLIEISGRVLDTGGRPLSGAAVTVWQANAAGRYSNPVDKNPAPLDPNFLGVASFDVAADGRYRLRTVKPGPYPEPSGTIRTPHIHFDVTHGDYRLVTQMYFPGRAPERQGPASLHTCRPAIAIPTAAICRPAPAHEPGLMAFEWDIVLLT